MDSTSNIFIIFVIILFIFFTSMDEDLNKYIERKSYTFLFLIIIVAFIYQKIHLGWLLVIMGIFMYLNMDLTTKYGPQMKKWLNRIKAKMNQLNGNKSNKKLRVSDKQEHFSSNGYDDSENIDNAEDNNYDVKPYVINELQKEIQNLPIKTSNNISINNSSINNFSQNPVQEEKPLQEPFKLNVQEIKEMYENIKNQLSELDKK